MDAKTIETIQIGTIIIVAVAMFALWRFYKTHQSQWAYTIPPFSWLILIELFYGAVLLRNHFSWFMRVDYVFWSAILRLYVAVLIAGVAIMLAYERLIFRK